MQSDHFSQDINQIVAALAGQGHACALAVVLETRGSTPCKAGAKAVMDENRVLHGTIGGGSVEATTQRRAAGVLEDDQPAVFDFSLDGRVIADGEPVCGGSMRVLLDPTLARHRDAYTAASAILQSRRRGVLLTTVRGEVSCAVEVECMAEESILPDLGFPGADSIRLALKREETKLFVAASEPAEQRREVLVEPLIPKPVVLLVGGGHVAQAVAAQASLVGFEIVVIDDRDDFTRQERFPENTTTHCGDIGDEVAGFPLAEDTYVVIVTRDHKHDGDALASCLNRRAAYIGMIGSRRKIAMMRKDFVDAGRCNAADFDRIYAPIGLDIGAVTAPEIATSIVAQLIAVRHTGTAPKISPA